MRDDFTQPIKEILAKRVAYRCSNPECRQLTSGPQEDPSKAINVGVAAHITAASPEGPRFDHSLTPSERQSAENGIWLCQTCAKLVDNDSKRYQVSTLYRWKTLAEMAAIQELETRSSSANDSFHKMARCENLMPELIEEMREDLIKNPLSREFVILKKAWTYNSPGPFLAYYYDDHSELDNKLRILLNNGLISDITSTNVPRYTFAEEFVQYITRERLS